MSDAVGPWWATAKLGLCRSGADRDRTDDIQLAKLALSQLSYSPRKEVVGLDGLEPSTLRLSGVRSNHLSYRPMQGS